ncbi:uncharacterized protein E0L32_001299 [Thyridium curvatum]|uniref:laccase n=1 Tax=Thyridium curvatum TaxID=1093900 RepID=A0A507AKG9_9PEZI|nr:uncharacterized protein E0L32_001299 [Thyridium curvatum]TPX10102.1 hypothetical protein E0L32_001299 [Thyridium curvatum]
MWSCSRLLVPLLGMMLFRSVHAAPPAPVDVELVKRAGRNCNTASNRRTWCDGFSLDTDYEVPGNTPTGTVVSYTFVLTEVNNWVGPDGVVKNKFMLVNGQYPGPTIVADWGDTIQVTVINNLETNGTSIHWHGVRQLNSNIQDGANGLTECPIPPKGGSKVYRFRATQYGTSWYHSHFSAQYDNGIVGTILINGPASLPYEVDLGVFPITDYYYASADELLAITSRNAPPPADNILFNGTNKHPSTGQGRYAEVTLTPGKRHRLRIINTSADASFTVSLVDHDMTVIASDFVPVQSVTVNKLFVAIGQRFDVTIDASKVVGNYWFNVTFEASGACGASVNPHPAAVFRYQGAPKTDPTNPGTAVVPEPCVDKLDLVPVVTRTVSTSDFQPTIDNTLNVSLDLAPTFVWKINSSAINVDWNRPVLEYVMEGNTSYPQSENIISVNGKDRWAYWLIENEVGFNIAHPLHLHGHDFVVLGRSAVGAIGPFNAAADTRTLNGNNPARRDVTMLPAQGWVVLAFRTDNPGAWLFHCHIAWHVSAGLAVDFLENVGDLRQNIAPGDKADFDRNCNAWRAYFPEFDPFPKTDSGLRMMN